MPLRGRLQCDYIVEILALENAGWMVEQGVPCELLYLSLDTSVCLIVILDSESLVLACLPARDIMRSNLNSMRFRSENQDIQIMVVSGYYNRLSFPLSWNVM